MDKGQVVLPELKRPERYKQTHKGPNNAWETWHYHAYEADAYIDALQAKLQKAEEERDASTTRAELAEADCIEAAQLGQRAADLGLELYSREAAAIARAEKAEAALAALQNPMEGAEGRGIYVASRASVPKRSAMWRNYRDGGAHIISTWIDEAGEGESESLADLWERIRWEVIGSAALILYAEGGDFPLKGALIEVGMALAVGLPVLVVIPGVLLDAHSFRPLGSWAKHPLVSFHDSVVAALASVTGSGEEKR